MYIEKYGDEKLANEIADDMMRKDLKDGVQTIRYQLSTLMTTNGQAPFATIYLEVEEGNEYEEEMALISEEMIRDRKSTRLNSSHANISYAVFCLKKKKKT